MDDSNLKILFESGDTTVLKLSGGAEKEESIDSATGEAVTKGKVTGKPGKVTVTAGPYDVDELAADEAECDFFVVKVASIGAADTEPPGLSVTDDDAGVEDPVQTLVVPASETGGVKISVTPDPDLAEADLPKKWAITKVGGTLSLPGAPGKLSATVSEAAPGDITVQLKCHPKTKEHFRVRVVVTSGPFPGVATIAARDSKYPWNGTAPPPTVTITW